MKFEQSAVEEAVVSDRFWFSHKQKAWRAQIGDLCSRFAVIDGKEVEYTECITGGRDGEATCVSRYDDVVYLGVGRFSRMEGDCDDLFHFSFDWEDRPRRMWRAQL